MRSKSCVFLAILLCTSAASRALAVASLTPLGHLLGGAYSEAYGVSADGSVVVGRSSDQAFRWTSDGGMVGLGDLPGGSFSSTAQGISGDGSVIVGYGTSPSFLEAFHWTNGGGMTGLGTLPGWPGSDAIGVSADGSAVVGFSHDAGWRGQAFRWTSGGGMVGLGTLPGRSGSYAIGVTADGSVIVGYSSDSVLYSGGQAFRWTSGGGMVGLGIVPGGTYSAANEVSADGSVVVGVSGSASGPQAFHWTSGGGMVGLGDLPGGSFDSQPGGISGDGSVIVGYGTSATGQTAFRWTSDGGMRALWDVLLSHGVDPAADGWSRLGFAEAISADGNTIVGEGIRNGNTEAFVAVIPTIVPEPGAGALALLGVSSILLVRRRSLWRPNKLKVLPFQVLGAVLTLAIVLATGTASAQEADTITISGTFSMGTLAGTIGPDLAQVYANGYDHTWTLTLRGTTQSHFSNVDWENTLELDATTIIHAMSFDLKFFGPDAATLNGIVSEHIAGGDVGIRLDNIYPYVYGEDGFSLMDVRLSGPDMYLWARQGLIGESTLFPADADRHPVVGPEPFSMWTDYSQLADSRPGNDGAIISWNSILTFVAGIPTGDFNHDGTVDAADYISIRKQYSALISGAGLTAYQTWRTSFGRSAAGSGATVAVPEPTALMSLMIGAISIPGRSRRRRGC